MVGYKFYEYRYYLTKEDKDNIFEFIKNKLNLENIIDANLSNDDGATVLTIKGFEEVIENVNL